VLLAATASKLAAARVHIWHRNLSCMHLMSAEIFKDTYTLIAKKSVEIFDSLH